MHASPNVCHFQMRSCMENCAISWREIVKNTLYIQETIPYRTETRKKWILRYWFSGFSSKNKHDPIIPFTYISWLMWSPLRDRMMHNVQSPSLKTSDEEFVKKITDFRDYCGESASWAERTDWINVRRINSAILSRKWLLYQTSNKTLHCWISSGKAIYIIVLNQMSPRHISSILYEYPQFTMWLPLFLVDAYSVYSSVRKFA